jgi:hypothetical protein
MRAMRQRVIGTRVEIAAYLALLVALAIGAVILADFVLGIGAGLAALALVGAVIARRGERDRDAVDHQGDD